MTYIQFGDSKTGTQKCTTRNKKNTYTDTKNSWGYILQLKKISKNETQYLHKYH